MERRIKISARHRRFIALHVDRPTESLDDLRAKYVKRREREQTRMEFAAADGGATKATAIIL